MLTWTVRCANQEASGAQSTFANPGKARWTLADLPTPGGSPTRTLLGRQLRDELHRALNPGLQQVVVRDARRADQHPALHRPARDVELADVGFSQRRLGLLRRESHDQGLLPHAHTHIAVEQKADA